MIKFECPNCGQHFTADRESYGEESFCTSCLKELRIPFPDAQHPEITPVSKWAPVVVWMRWIAVLPAAILSYFITILFIVALSHLWEVPRMIQDVYNCLIGSIAFITAGMWVAPRHEFWTSIALSIVFSSTLIAVCFLDLYVPDYSVWQKIWAWICAAISIGAAISVSRKALREESKQ